MSRPPSLSLGAGLALLEGLVLLGYAVLEVAYATSGRVGLAVTTSIFFAVVGGALVACAYGLWHSSSWARSPVVVVQLIILLTSWSFVGGRTTPVAVVLAVGSVTTLVGVLHPRSTEALAGEPDTDPADG